MKWFVTKWIRPMWELMPKSVVSMIVKSWKWKKGASASTDRIPGPTETPTSIPQQHFPQNRLSSMVWEIRCPCIGPSFFIVDPPCANGAEYVSYEKIGVPAAASKTIRVYPRNVLFQHTSSHTLTTSSPSTVYHGWLCLTYWHAKRQHECTTTEMLGNWPAALIESVQVRVNSDVEVAVFDSV